MNQDQDATTPSSRGGMGAVPYAGGTLFRVWAPHADAVFVTGDFNDWSHDAAPMAHEENGYWSGDVSEAQAGDEYQFVIRNGNQKLLRSDPYARALEHSAGNAVIYDSDAFDWEGDAFSMPPWNELVLYELHVGTFSGEGTDGENGFRESIARLDYLTELGINAIELMPVAEFPGDTSWGYNTAYPFAVESAYGGPDAFKTFVREAHARGMAVLLDVVYNHLGPGDLDLWRFDGWGEDGWGGIYFYNDHRAETPWGDTRPDYGRPEVRRYIRDNVMMWLDDFRLDGLRWDGTVFIRNTGFDESSDEELPDGWRMMQDINAEVHRDRPERLIVAEDLQNNAALTRSASDGGAGFGAQWDAGFVHPVRAALTPSADAERDLESVRDAILHRFNDDAFERIIYTESHDEVANGRARLVEEIEGTPDEWAPQKRSTLGAGLVLTAPGIPLLFQGQELLEDEWFRASDPLDWDRLNKTDIAVLYRDLIALRRNLRGTTRGLTGQHIDCYHCDPDSGILAFHRWDEGGPCDSTLVVANLCGHGYDDYRLGFPSGGRWRVRLNSDWKGYSDTFGDHPSLGVEATSPGRDNLDAEGALSIGPYTLLILSQDAA